MLFIHIYKCINNIYKHIYYMPGLIEGIQFESQTSYNINSFHIGNSFYMKLSKLRAVAGRAGGTFFLMKNVGFFGKILKTISVWKYAQGAS